jgi:quinol-cytochrome oxidoreductase complex cytochrome b subunit
VRVRLLSRWRPRMPLFFARTAVVPVWILLFGLACLVSPPMAVGTSIGLLVGGVLVAPIVMILLCFALPRLFRRE